MTPRLRFLTERSDAFGNLTQARANLEALRRIADAMGDANAVAEVDATITTLDSLRAAVVRVEAKQMETEAA